MSTKQHTELAFEEAIEEALLNDGEYIKGSPDNYNKDYAVDEVLLLIRMKSLYGRRNTGFLPTLL